MIHHTHLLDGLSNMYAVGLREEGELTINIQEVNSSLLIVALIGTAASTESAQFLQK